MDPASAVAGLVGLAALILQTTATLRGLCQDYATASDDLGRVSSSLQTLQDLLREAIRLLNDSSVIRVTTMLTRSRLNLILHHCQKDLELWTSRIYHHNPKSDDSRLGKSWKKIIIAVDKPRLDVLTTNIMRYVDQIDALLGVMRSDLGVATNAAVAASIWAQGIFHFKIKKQLEAITHGVETLQTSQNGFQEGAYWRLDNIGAAVGSIEVTLHDIVQQNSTTDRPTFKPLPEAGRTLLPFVRNGDFVGRKVIIDKIEHQLELPGSNNRCAVYGLGGVGKSQVALEVAYRMQSVSPDISCYWVSAVSRTTFMQSYRDISSALQIPGSDDPNKDTLDLVKTWLQGDFSSKWLMIVDNVDDIKSLKGQAANNTDAGESGFDLLKYLPQCSHGKLLFTTRSKTAALRLTGNGSVIEIPSMDANEAQELLRVRLKDDDSTTTAQDCLDLVKALEYLPLAVSHAASYIREMDITPARYLRMFNDSDKKRTKLLTHTYEDLARDEGQSNTVLTTWRISFEQIERDSPEGARLLKLMATFHWQDIPQFLLRQNDLEDEDDFLDAVNPLLAFSLVKKSSDSKTFSMHRLIHIAIKSWDQSLEFEQVAEKLIVQVFPLLDIRRVSVEQRQRCRQLLPHAQAIVDALGIRGESSSSSTQIKFRVSLYLGVLGQYRHSREIAESLTRSFREFSDRDQSDVSISVLEDHITRMFLNEGNDKVALDRAQKALDERKELPPDNSDLIRAKDLIAMSLMAQGNNQAAEAQLRGAHEALERARGKRDPATIFVLLSLAVAYSGQERWKECAEAYQAALAVLLPSYGDHNDCVIRCVEGLAEAERCLYRTERGGELIRKAVALAEEIYGPDHPYTLRAILRLGCQYFDEGNAVAGFKAFQRVWKGYQRFYGDNSKITLTALKMVAVNHPDNDEGERLMRIAVQQARELWGPSATRTRQYEDALVWRQIRSGSASKHKEAEAYCRELFENRKKELGNDNPWTLGAQSLLGRTMLASFHTEEALILLKDAGERQLKLLGEHHSDLYKTECALILVYDITRGSTDYSLKEALLRKHLQNLQQQRGLQNRGVLELKSSLGYTLWSQNRSLASPAAKKLTQEGASLMIEAYDMQLKLYGKENDTAVETASRLAKYYDMVKEWDKAESLHRQVFEAYRKRFGEEVPETLAVETRVALAVIGQGRAKESLEMLERIIPILTRQFHDNPDRITLCLDLVVAGMVMAAALWGLDENEVALETLRKESTERILELPELSQNAPAMQYLLQELRLLDNEIRDDILATETRQWKPASAWPYPFKELEGFFPRKNQIHPSNIRRVKSWNAISTDLDRSPAQSPDEDRSATFRRLRGEPKPEFEPPPAPAQGWSCSRCETPIPITDFFYRCYDTACHDGKYAVCEKCHASGITCLDFKHLPHRRKAYFVCNCCEKEIQGRYTFHCEICEDGLYHACKPCYTSGRRCHASEHHMKKILQPCYTDYSWYGTRYCDSCGNVLEDGETYEHCQICSGDDYDLCRGCCDLGIKCKDDRHKLVKRVWRET